MDEEERDRTAKTVQSQKLKYLESRKNNFGKIKNSLYVDFATCGNKMSRETRWSEELSERFQRGVERVTSLFSKGRKIFVRAVLSLECFPFFRYI
jgi:hypothetical protein